jgi:hypothetical protein
MDALLKPPLDTERTMPVAAPFPQHQILRTEVTLPILMRTETVSKTTTDPAFSFQKNVKSSGHKIVMNCEYRSLADSAGPDQAAQYIQDLNQASKSLSYTVDW